MTKAKTSEKTESSSEKPSWVALKPAEVEKIVLDLHKQGEHPAKIGLILRDKHGVPKAKLLGKKIKQIIINAKGEVKSEKSFVEEKIKKLQEHGAKNKHDHTAHRSLTKKLWIIRKLSN